jgi:hypothetical protein
MDFNKHNMEYGSVTSNGGKAKEANNKLVKKKQQLVVQIEQLKQKRIQ